MKHTFAIATFVLAAGCVRPAPRIESAPLPNTPSRPQPAELPVQQQATPVAVLAAPSQPVPPAADTVHVDAQEVKRRAAEVFGETIVAAVTVPSAATISSVPTAEADVTAVGPSWDIDVKSYESTDRVEHYVRIFTGRAKERIASHLERGSRYEPMIRARMRAGGIPEDMYYLALVESGFDPNAYSRAAAVGMWQFMTSTARDMGMRVDWWIDERRDPFRSTTAAVRFIKGLNEQFGSLYLAAAAYNGGPGRVARGLSRYADDLEGTTGDDLFFALAEKDYLRNETREYVPQLIAAALIAKEPDRYGMRFTPQPPLTYDSVRVAPATALAAVARAADTTVETIRELNPHVLRGVTPPRDSFYVRVPDGRADAASAALAEMPKSSRVGLFTVESKKGESIASIARSNGLAARQLALYNPKLKQLKSGNLAPGQMVLVPTSAVAAIASSVPDPDIERYGSGAGSGSMHVVKSGQTLSGIAKKYGTTSDALMRMNGLKRPLIFPGQSLVVKGKARKPNGAKAAAGKVKSGKSQGGNAKAGKAKAGKAKGGKANAQAPKTKKKTGVSAKKTPARLTRKK